MKSKLFATLVFSFFYTTFLFAQASLEHINGKYFAADGLEFENMMKMKKKQKDDISINFIGEQNGKIENMLLLKWKGGELKAYLDEKLYNKKKVVWFKAGENTFFELEPGVIAIANSDGSKVGDVLAKDQSKLKDFDIETAKALLDEKTSELKSAANDAAFQKMMGFEAFKTNLKKVVFADNRALMTNSYDGTPKEDPKKYIRTQVIGKSIWYNFFSDVNPQMKYGKTAEINIEYEMEGVKKDRKSVARLGRKWAGSVPKVEMPDGYKFTYPRSFSDQPLKVYDYAFLALMNEMNGKLLMGKTYNMKVTIYAYKDGANVATLAEGTIGLKYEPESQAAMELWVKWISEME